MKIISYLLMVFGICTIIITGQKSFSQKNKISPKVLELMKQKSENIPVMILLKDQADLSKIELIQTKDEKSKLIYKLLTDVAKNTQISLVEFLNSKNLEFRQFYITNLISVSSVSSELIEELSQREDVSQIFLNAKITNSLPKGNNNKTEEMPGVGDNLISTGADKVWKEFKASGEGIVIAGQDTGVYYNHPALIKKYRGSLADEALEHNYNWHDSVHKNEQQNPCGFDSKIPCDDHGHGTHTIGTVVGSDQTTTVGMAPNAKWISCRNMDGGVGTPTTYLECFEFFLAPYPFGGNPMTDGKPELAPHVMNNSWGCPASEGCTGQEFVHALEVLKKAGMFVVVSAGNEGSSCGSIKDQPATITDFTFSVGALDHRTGKIAFFSSRGPSALDQKIGPDVSAPGVTITSTIPGGGYQGSGWSGTSMAGPHLVGAVALLWSARPELIGKVDETIEILQKNSTPKTSLENCGGVVGSSIPNNTYGFGFFNVYNAIKSLSSVNN